MRKSKREPTVVQKLPRGKYEIKFGLAGQEVESIATTKSSVDAYKPKSFSQDRGEYNSSPTRRVDINVDDGETSISLHPRYVFITHLKVRDRLGGIGKELVRIAQAIATLEGCGEIGGFVGSAHGTMEFLKSIGFEDAHFEIWTGGMWSVYNLMGRNYYLEGDYFSAPDRERKNKVPTPRDMIDEYGWDYASRPFGIDGEMIAPTREKERDIVNEGLSSHPGRLRVRKEVADEWWDGTYSLFFRDRVARVNKAANMETVGTDKIIIKEERR